MSKTFSHPVKFECANGCQTFGQCPGHEVRVTLKHTSGHVVIQERNIGMENWTDTESFDDNRWDAIMDAYESITRASQNRKIPAQPE